MNKCPRCNLPQEGIYRCQYCGYLLSKNKKKHNKTIRKKLKYIIGALNKDQIVTSNKRSKIRSMNNATRKLKLTDNGGTRSGNDRRKFLCMTYFPEKRLGRDRRKGLDRRSQVARKKRPERRFSLNNRKAYPCER